MTLQRQKILDIVRGSDTHLTAEQIFFSAKHQLPNIVMATVYNNLNYLSQNGYIRKIKIYGEADCYDKLLTPHDHLICDICGKISDVEIENITHKIERQYEIKIISYELNLHYICKECQKKQL